MRIILFLTMVLPNFIGCNTPDDTGFSPLAEKWCEYDSSFSAIKVDITSSDPLPPNLALGFNGKDVDIDECREWKPIKLNQDRTKGTLIYYLHDNSEEYNLYFPNGLGDPASSLINIVLYSRTNCTDPHTPFQEISDIGISWEPGYDNGEHCSVTDYTGESQIDL